MKRLSIILVLMLLYSCEQTNKTKISTENSPELYDTFDSDNHLKPDFDKTVFDSLHSWDFGWAILKPINIAPDQEKEKALSRRLSPGQKTIYFFWYLDEEVTNGGFIQFYWNGNRRYLHPIIHGLKLIGDTALLHLIEKADNEYLKNKEKFDLQRERNDWKPLYDNLKEFDKFDNEYYKIHDKTMDLIEKYARKHITEFINLK